MPYLIGLTGTIASGKSTAADFFTAQGITVIDADKIARSLTEQESPALQTIISHFGQSFLNTNGTLNRQKLKQTIIEHPDEKKWLESYLHPQIRKHIQAQINAVKSPYGIVDIPLLTRREDFPYLNHILLLEIDESQQIKRLMARDNCSEQEALQMIAIQPNQAVRRALADDIVQNNGDPTQFKQVLEKLHTRYLAQASKP